MSTKKIQQVHTKTEKAQKPSVQKGGYRTTHGCTQHWEQNHSNESDDALHRTSRMLKTLTASVIRNTWIPSMRSSSASKECSLSTEARARMAKSKGAGRGKQLPRTTLLQDHLSVLMIKMEWNQHSKNLHPMTRIIQLI